MGQYDEVVQRQRLLLEAEEWANGVRSLHSHRTSSCWYDDRPQDTADGKFVVDTQYNGGEIERTIYSDKGFELETVIFGKRLEGEDLIFEYSKSTN